MEIDIIQLIVTHKAEEIILDEAILKTTSYLFLAMPPAGFYNVQFFSIAFSGPCHEKALSIFTNM